MFLHARTRSYTKCNLYLIVESENYGVYKPATNLAVDEWLKVVEREYGYFTIHTY
jgi:hypothetical protein